MSPDLVKAGSSYGGDVYIVNRSELDRDERQLITRNAGEHFLRGLMIPDPCPRSSTGSGLELLEMAPEEEGIETALPGKVIWPSLRRWPVDKAVTSGRMMLVPFRHVNPSEVGGDNEHRQLRLYASLLKVWNQGRSPTTVVNRHDVGDLTQFAEEAAQTTDLGTIGALRDQVAVIAERIERRDRDVRLERLREDASKIARQDPRELLNSLAVDHGLSWHTLATMLNVTPTAIRKWRRGGSLTPENREQLAGLVAFFDLVKGVREPIADMGSWVEMRVREDTTLTPAEMYAAGPGPRWLLLEWARGYVDTAAMLDRFDPHWRENHARDPNYVVGEGPGGERAIVPR